MVPERVAYDRVVLTTGRGSGICFGLANWAIVVGFWWFLQFWKALFKVDEECHTFRALATSLNNGNSMLKMDFERILLQIYRAKSLAKLSIFVWFLTHFWHVKWSRLIFQIHFRTALQFEFSTFFLYMWSLNYLLFRFVFQHPFPVSEHHFTVSEQPFLF